MSTSPTGTQNTVRAFWSTCVFFYQNSLALLGISIAWFFLSLPLVTIGPATLGGYYAIGLLKNTGSLDHDAILNLVHSQLGSAFVMGIAPIISVSIGTKSFLIYSSTSQIHYVLIFLFSTYISIYCILIIIPAFIALAQDESLIDSLRFGRAWLGSNPISGLLMGTITLLIFIVCAIFTIALVLILPGFSFTFHWFIVEDALLRSDRTTGKMEAR